MILSTRVALICLSLLPATLFAQLRSMEDIRQIAQTYFARQSGVGETRASQSTEYIPSSAILSGMSGPEAFYLCNRSSEGFVLVSADVSQPEVFGYSPVAYQANQALPAGLLDLMRSYALIPDVFSVPVPLSAQASVSPMLQTQWGQGDPFNRMCPRDGIDRSFTGCVATSVAQIMKYYRWPEKKGTGKISYVTETQKIPVSVDLSDNTLAWDLMLDEYKPDQFSNAQANAVAKLMYVVGASCQMDYSSAVSFSYISDVSAGLSRYFGYDRDMCVLLGEVMPADTWHSFIVAELNQSRPVLFGGTEAKGAGHAFVLDGYDTQGGSIYYHVNWGWDGTGDGYYLISNLTPVHQGVDMGVGTFSAGQTLLLNFQPDDGKVNPVYAQVGDLTLSQTDFNAGERLMFDLSFKSLFCALTGDFNGTIQLEVVNESGVVHGRDSIQSISLTSRLMCHGTLGDLQMGPFPEGIYTLRMYLESNDGRKIECLPNYPWPQIKVGGKADSIDGIMPDSEASSAISLMGIEIKNAGQQTLPAGFYVKGGQKVLVR